MVTDKKDNSRNWLEHVVTGVAALLVLCTLGFLIFKSISQEQTPPDIQVFIGDVVPKDQGYAVPVKVKNKGTQTAKDITIEIVSGEGESEEKGEISFQYLPGKSSVRGWVIFSNKPNGSSMTTHVLGYATP